jgi:thiol:disulfide interchange protein
MRIQSAAFLLSLGMGMGIHGIAQGPIQPVQWKGSLESGSAATPGSKGVLEVSASIQEGWHVYGLTQPPGGPTSLRIALDENAIAQSAGAPSGSAPVKKHDPSFDLDTQVYLHSIILHLPFQVKADSPAGKQALPVSVRFQACSDQMCLPPRTVHLSVPIEVPAR